MQYEAKAQTECTVSDIHASTAVYKILLSPNKACSLVPYFKLVWYEILIQAEVGENTLPYGQNSLTVHKHLVQPKYP